MSELGTIRERIDRASAFFEHLDGIVLTTFNLNAAFLEEQVLPIVCGVEAKTAAARRMELHRRLGTTPCTVFYDPTSATSISGNYRYIARPVPLRGRFFHPKLVIIAGNTEDGTTWVYLAVSSANLTLSGWGRNAESFGETWIHTKRQPSWKALDEMLLWLQTHAPLGEKSSDFDAVVRIRKALERMPNRKRFSDDGKSPWSDTLYAQLYFSLVNTDGLQEFMKQGRTRRPSALWAYSPYWSEVAEQVRAFNARETVLVPAMRRDGEGLGLTRKEAENLPLGIEIQRNDEDDGIRFWHMKSYWILHGDKIYTAVGSCNFTKAGLSGENGNAEAMLVFEFESKSDPNFLPESNEDARTYLAEVPLQEEEVPTPTPVAIVVAFDWRTMCWRWWLDAGSRQSKFTLTVPGISSFPVKPGTGKEPGPPPPKGSSFTIAYITNNETKKWTGQVVELNLGYSSRTYGRPLTANEILESWRGRTPNTVNDDDESDEGNINTGNNGDDIEPKTLAAFDAVNLYDLYRSIQTLRKELSNLETQPQIQQALLVGRPDSVIALANLANQSTEVPTIRYLILRELCGILSDWDHLLEDDLIAMVREFFQKAKDQTKELLLNEVGGNKKKTNKMLDWFEARLSKFDREIL